MNMEDKSAIISLRHTNITGGDSVVLYDVTLEIFQGDFVYIVGKVGTGKTSIIRTIIAETPLTKGEGEVCGYSLKGLKEKDIPYLRRKLGVVFQDFQLLMDRTVKENLSFVLRATGWKDEKAMEDRMQAVLEAVGMTLKAHKMPHQLSGGEQQRIAIARALLNDPQVIVADEPTGNLDAETADGIMQLLTSINRDKGTAVIMVTHNRQIFEKYPGRIFECKDEGCNEEDEGCFENEQ